MALKHKMHGHDARDLVRLLRPRLFAVLWVCVLGFVLVLYRLYQLQILRGEELSSRGRRNYVQKVEIPHDRGIIYDRFGKILVDNRPSLDVQLIPAFLGKGETRERTLLRLADLVGLTNEERQNLLKTVKERLGLSQFKPVLVKRDLDSQQVEAIEAERGIFKLDGVDIIEGRKRTYPYGTLAAHLLGYVNEIDPTTLQKEKSQGNPLNYESGDTLGREGIERTFELELRGLDGYQQVVVDAKGRRVRDTYIESLLGRLSEVPPEPGHNLYLSLDLELQKKVEEIFVGEAGAVVVLDVKTGGVLAYLSKPAYDPNLVSGSLAPEIKQKLDDDPLKPWINRPIYGQYVPGSTFKVVTSLAALIQGVNPKETVYCPGRFHLGRHTWRCWKDSGHGSVNLKDAIKMSCDTYFYTMANRMGLDPIAHAGKLLGLGTKTGIALRSEKPGLMPDEAFHNRVDAASGGYQRGMAINVAIGQGSVLVTPLQLARVYASIANGGQVLVPQLIHHIETADHRVVKRMLPEVKNLAPSYGVVTEVIGQPPTTLQVSESRIVNTLDVSEKFLDVIREGLVAVVNEPGGTAYSKRSKVVSFAGKTGTAQVVKLGTSRVDVENMDYFSRDHAWFAAYASTTEPEIAVAVLYEHGGHGAAVAAPVAQHVIEAYYELKEQRLGKQALEMTP